VNRLGHLALVGYLIGVPNLFAASGSAQSPSIPPSWKDVPDLDEYADPTDFEKFTVPSRTDPTKRVRYLEQVEMLIGKITYGLGRPKRCYSQYKKLADELKIPWAAYHFCIAADRAYPGSNTDFPRVVQKPELQAQHFVRSIQKHHDVRKREYVVMVADLEINDGNLMTADDAIRFMDEVHRLTHQYPIVYTSSRYIKDVLVPQKKKGKISSQMWNQLKQRQLWYCRYPDCAKKHFFNLAAAQQENAKKKDILSPIPEAPWNGWQLWQYAEAADKHKDGVAAYQVRPVDLNFVDLKHTGPFRSWYLSHAWDYNLHGAFTLPAPRLQRHKRQPPS
jgi:hypothetical protein